MDSAHPWALALTQNGSIEPIKSRYGEYAARRSAKAFHQLALHIVCIRHRVRDHNQPKLEFSQTLSVTSLIIRYAILSDIIRNHVSYGKGYVSQQSRSTSDVLSSIPFLSFDILPEIARPYLDPLSLQRHVLRFRHDRCPPSYHHL